MPISISTLRLGAMDNFIHFVTDTATTQTMVVDPAWDDETIAEHIDHNDFSLCGVLLTHSHTDHISALLDVVNDYDVPVYITRAEFRLGRARVSHPNYIQDGDIIPLGNSEITVIETPGHTIGSVAFHVDNALISGDTLFVDGCGRCNFYESDVEKMWESLQKLKTLPDDTVIYVGHDYGQKATDTIGNQKRTNPYLLIDDKAFFIDFRMNLQAHYRSIPFAPSSATEMQAIKDKHAGYQT